ARHLRALRPRGRPPARRGHRFGRPLRVRGLRRMGRKLALASALAGAALAFVLPGAAGAATTLGETFVPGGCAEDTYIQSDTPSGAPSYTAPFDGVITRWSYQSDASPPPSVRLKVARDLGGGSFKIVAQSALEDITANTLNTYQSRI